MVTPAGPCGWVEQISTSGCVCISCLTARGQGQQPPRGRVLGAAPVTLFLWVSPPKAGSWRRTAQHPFSTSSERPFTFILLLVGQLDFHSCMWSPTLHPFTHLVTHFAFAIVNVGNKALNTQTSRVGLTICASPAGAYGSWASHTAPPAGLQAGSQAMPGSSTLRFLSLGHLPVS